MHQLTNDNSCPLNNFKNIGSLTGSFLLSAVFFLATKVSLRQTNEICGGFFMGTKSPTLAFGDMLLNLSKVSIK